MRIILYANSVGNIAGFPITQIVHATYHTNENTRPFFVRKTLNLKILIHFKTASS